MTIRSSAAREILPLIEALRRGPGVERDGAVARLTVIGERGVPHLLDLLADAVAPVPAHVAALSVLETISDTRAFDAALARLDAPRPEIAGAAAAVIRRWLSGGAGDRALDRLTGVALDRTRDARVRLAALAAVADLPADTRAPLWNALAGDDDPQVRAFVSAKDVVEDMADRAPALPVAGTPAGVRRWIDRLAPDTPLPTLHQLVEYIRGREAQASSAADCAAWTTTRAEVHQVLAARDSRVALYDLRETLEGAHGPLPPAFLRAAERIGDATVLEPLARVYVEAGGEAWWRERVRAAARGIIAREKLTARHAAMKRVKAKYPAAYDAFTRKT